MNEQVDAEIRRAMREGAQVQVATSLQKISPIETVTDAMLEAAVSTWLKEDAPHLSLRDMLRRSLEAAMRVGMEQKK